MRIDEYFESNGSYTEFKVEETFDGIVPVSLLFDRSLQ
jgi:hypothetical protein